MDHRSLVTAVGTSLIALALSAVPAAAASPTPMGSPAPSLVPADGFGFVATGSLADPRIGATATLLDDGRVLVIGGYDVASAEIWGPATGRWSMSGSMSGPREGATATLLPDGRFLLAGGWEMADPTCQGFCRIDATVSASIWDPATGVITPLTTMTHPRAKHAAVLLRDGRVLLVGFHTHGDYDATAELFQPRTAPVP